MNTLAFTVPMLFFWILTLAAFTVMLAEYNKAQQAKNDIKIWCWDDFYCEKVCAKKDSSNPNSPGVTPDGLHLTNPIFTSDWKGKTGMASTLFGVKSALNQYCSVDPVTKKNGCENCPDNFTSTPDNLVQNCFQNCTNSTPSKSNNPNCNPKK